VLGFSLGGYAALELAPMRPRLLRRIVLAGTADSGHGFLDQYPTPFADHVDAFLNGG
jgi:pimeloyl-ACP methyl ester carboxylesterase